MESLDRWEWRIGALAGWGECAWEQHGNKLRRITIFTGVQPNGALSFAKAMALLWMGDQQGLEQFDADKLVIASRPPKAGNEKDLARLWGGSNLVIPGANGPQGRI